MSVTAEDLKGLNVETPSDEVKKRPVFNKQKEKVGELDYVDARYVYDLFDEVCGAPNWQNKHREVKGGVVCAVGVNVDGEWVWKEDVGTPSTIEEVKGTYSDAFKRSAVLWGVARDLYDTRSGQGGRGPKGGGGQSSTRTRAKTGQKVSFPVRNDEAPWVCPDHEKVVAWPAGVSASGRNYDAFYACPEGRSCSQRAPRGLKVQPEHLSASSAKDMDDLPF